MYGLLYKFFMKVSVSLSPLGYYNQPKTGVTYNDKLSIRSDLKSV